MKIKVALLFVVLIVLLHVPKAQTLTYGSTSGAPTNAYVMLADDSKSTPPTTTPIQLKGDDATRIKDSYNALVNANRELQYNILQARYNLSVPKDWEFDLATFSFKPPTPAPQVPASKESKP